MGSVVVSGANIKCTMGQGAGTLNVTSQLICKAGKKHIATVQDTIPMANVGTCGMCISMANPIVASATAAALGVLTPQPCIPSPVGMWMPVGKIKISGIPSVSADATLICSYAGTISIVSTGQVIVLEK